MRATPLTLFTPGRVNLQLEQWDSSLAPFILCSIKGLPSLPVVEVGVNIVACEVPPLKAGQYSL